jgi:hypothetical protein
MTTQTETSGGDEPYPTSTRSKDWKGITAEDIPHGWIDNMVKRLFDELNRQILRVENLAGQDEAKRPGTGDREKDKLLRKQQESTPAAAATREQDSRTLARLQGSLARLTKMEMERAVIRSTKSNRSRNQHRAKLLRDMEGAQSGPADQLHKESE